jgi:Protein of unknown function (DUF3830)
MSEVRIAAGPFELGGRLERGSAPGTCAAFLGLLPWRERIVHVRWSGEACWIPLGDMDLQLGAENATSHPAPGQVLLYPGGPSETELLLPYGGTCFSSIVGQLAGNHFLTIEEGAEHLRELGQKCLWEGAQEIIFELGSVR